MTGLPEGYLKVGRQLNVLIAGDDQPYPSRLEDWAPSAPDRLVLAYPMRNLVPVRLAPGDRVTVEAVGERGVYRLDAVVLGRAFPQPGESGVPVLVVKAAGEWVRHQRREFFRVALGMTPARAMRVDPDGRTVRVNLRLRDISGGGLGIVTDRPLKVGDRLEVELNLNGSGAFLVRVEVVWVRSRPGRALTFEAGAKFVDIEPARQEAIVKFCLRRQLKQRRPAEE